MTLTQRLQALLDHLGLDRAHVGARMPQDWQPLAADLTDRVASLTLLCPSFVDPTAMAPLASRTLVLASDLPAYSHQIIDALAARPAARLVPLADYRPHLWTDIVHDHADLVFNELLAITNQAKPQVNLPAVTLSARGEVDGITFDAAGSGPPLLLLPLGLAPSGWTPLIERLRAHFCTIVLGGPELGMLPLLEQRGESVGYRKMLRNLFEWIVPQSGESVLEVGCGSGVVLRWLAEWLGGEHALTGVDINAYLLREADALVHKAGLADQIALRLGNAEELPFPDNHFDVAFSTTVMEEVHADRMLAELIRVTKPGGRVGVIVRALDVPMVINLDVDEALRQRFEIGSRPDEGKGCASATLYRRFQQSPLVDVRFGPQLAVFHDAFGTVEQFMQAGFLTTLSGDQAEAWQAARRRAETNGTFFLAWPHHAAAGRVLG